jgi:hypothetical protein
MTELHATTPKIEPAEPQAKRRKKACQYACFSPLLPFYVLYGVLRNTSVRSRPCGVSLIMVMHSLGVLLMVLAAQPKNCDRAE